MGIHVGEPHGLHTGTAGPVGPRGSTGPAGTIVDFAGPDLPSSWLNCDGAAVNRITYAALFAAIGVTWGVGDGATTFNVPDLRGRSSVGEGQGAGLTDRVLAVTDGEEDHVLVIGELAQHVHTEIASQFSGDAQPGPGAGTQPFGANTGPEGGDQAHNTMHPFAVVKKIIKT